MKLLTIAGRTEVRDSSTRPMRAKRYMAASKEPENRRAPVRKRFPIEADWKLKVEAGGRARLTISRWRWARMERINSACGVGIG